MDNYYNGPLLSPFLTDLRPFVQNFLKYFRVLVVHLNEFPISGDYVSDFNDFNSL